jgi:hypothetical protein
LTEELVTLRAKGRTWAQIEAESGIPAAQCAVRVQEYLRTSYTDATVTDARQLQIRRLEMLMGYLWEQVEAGDFLTQGRNTTNLINVIQQVTELLDLKSDRLRDAQIQLTQEQGGLILVILQAIQATLMNNILDTLSLQSEYNSSTGKRGIEDITSFRAVLERDWSGWFASAADQALDEAGADNNSATASMQHELARPRAIQGRTVNTITGEITGG